MVFKTLLNLPKMIGYKSYYKLKQIHFVLSEFITTLNYIKGKPIKHFIVYKFNQKKKKITLANSIVY